MQTEATPKLVHEGRNVKRIREIFGIKQEALAMDLGVSQQAVSKLEEREILDKDMLEKVAKALKVTPEAIKNFSEEATICNIQNNYEGSNAGATNVNTNNNNCTINTFDKVIELYERMLKDKDAMIEKLETLLKVNS